MGNIRSGFKKAVESYLEAINGSFYSPMEIGAGPDIRPRKEKIISLYREIPTEVRVNHLYFLLKTMSENAGEPRLTGWRRDLALELTKELEKI